jgi:hypothetical protein
VRNGAEKALIEIELFNPKGPNYVIAREITRDNRSSWKLQGKPVTQGEVPILAHSSSNLNFKLSIFVRLKKLPKVSTFK